MDEPTRQTLVELVQAGVALIVVGDTAAVAQGAPVVTFDLDIVHRRTSEDVDRLLAGSLPTAPTIASISKAGASRRRASSALAPGT